MCESVGMCVERAPVKATMTGQRVADIAAEVLRHQAVNADYRRLVLAAGSPAALARPGQFFQLACPDAGMPGAMAPFFRRPMSCYRADPQTGEVEFLYKVVGAGTQGLARLVPGDALSLLGPLGHGFSMNADWHHVAVIGRGVGLATLAPLAEWAAALGVRVTAVLSARERGVLMSQERFRTAGADVVEVTDQEGSSAPDAIEQRLRALHAARPIDALYTCGSRRLVMMLQALAQDLGIYGEVALEQQMACGLGMCHCCVRSFKSGGQAVARRVCWDGPVFALQEVL